VRYSRTQLARALDPLGLSLGVRARGARVRALAERPRRARRADRDGGSGHVTGRALRSALGDSVIRSTLFEIRRIGDDIVVVGSGPRHGVGMSQWGAQAMAERGADYRQILARSSPEPAGTEEPVNAIESASCRSRRRRAVAARHARADGADLPDLLSSC
jgi:stage II sporulation protein D